VLQGETYGATPPVITSKEANGYQSKTGQRKWLSGARLFYPAASCGALPTPGPSSLRLLKHAVCRRFLDNSLLLYSSPSRRTCAMFFTIVPLASSSFSAQTSAPPSPLESMYSIFKNIVNGFSKV